MNVLDLFSGIGGFSLGLERAGMRTVAFCEIEPYCRKVLRKHWPEVPIYEDITRLSSDRIDHQIDLICGGYPCQPFSLAGKRKGAQDTRALWPEMFRLIKELRPTWVIGENVGGHVSMGLDETLFDLESEGYQTRAFIIPAVGVDAPHKRDRVWIVANSTSKRCGKTREYRPEQFTEWTSFCCESEQRRWPTEPGVGNTFDGLSSELDRGRLNAKKTLKIAKQNLSDVQKIVRPETIRKEIGRLNSISQAQILLAILCEYSERKDIRWMEMERKEAERELLRSVWKHIEIACSPLRPRLNELCAREFANALRELSRNTPSQYTKVWATDRWEDDLQRTVNRLSSKNRTDQIRALGNAVVPQIVEVIGRAIMSVDEDLRKRMGIE